MRISDWGSDVCSSDLGPVASLRARHAFNPERGAHALRVLFLPAEAAGQNNEAPVRPIIGNFIGTDAGILHQGRNDGSVILVLRPQPCHPPSDTLSMSAQIGRAHV